MAHETEPLLRSRSAESGEDARSNYSNESVSHHHLEFPPGDKANPREWPATFKYGIVTILVAQAFTVTFTCTSLLPVVNTITEELTGGYRDPSASALLVTIWELGEAAGPLLIAPLSELYGRYPVVNCANVVFICTIFLAAFSQSMPFLIGARALTGVAVISNVLNPAIVGDIFHEDERGTSMSLIMLAPLMGGAVGPMIGGAVAQSIGWRQIFFIAACMAIACEVVFLTCFPETYKIAILKKRMAGLRSEVSSQEETGLVSPTKPFEKPNSHDGSDQLSHAIARPFRVLFGSGVLCILALFGSVAFSFFYVVSVALPGIFQDVYGYNEAETGVAFLCFSVGSFISIGICSSSMDKIYAYLKQRHSTSGQPEYRLPLAAIGGFALPICITLFGWVAEYKLHVSLLLLSVVSVGVSLLLAFIPISAYVVDAFGLCSASAMTGVIVLRCLMGTFLPLAANHIAASYGYGVCGTILGVISFSLAPIPLLLMKYGESWRQHSEYTRNE